MKIVYYRQHVYGMEKMYVFHPEQAFVISRLTGRKTITKQDIWCLKKLGHSVEETIMP